MKSETIPFQKKYQPSLIIMNKLIIPAIIGIFGLAPGTVTANAAESTTTSFTEKETEGVEVRPETRPQERFETRPEKRQDKRR